MEDFLGFIILVFLIWIVTKIGLSNVIIGIIVIIAIAIVCSIVSEKRKNSINGIEWIGPSLAGSGITYKTKVENNIIYAIFQSQYVNNEFEIGTIKVDSAGAYNVYVNRDGTKVRIGSVKHEKIIFDSSQVIALARKKWEGTIVKTPTPNIETVAEIFENSIISTIGSQDIIANYTGDKNLAGASVIALLYECDTYSPYHLFWSINAYDAETQWSVRKREL